MEIKTVRTVRLVLTLVALGLCILSRLFSNAAPELAIFFLVLTVATLIAEVVFSIKFYRCGWCKRLLPLRGMRGEYCPYCGGPL